LHKVADRQINNGAYVCFLAEVNINFAASTLLRTLCIPSPATGPVRHCS